MPDTPVGTSQTRRRGRPRKSDHVKVLAYLCARLEQVDPGQLANDLRMDLGRASIIAAGTAQSFRTGMAAEAALLREWMLVLEPKRLRLVQALVELSLREGASQAEQYSAAAAIDGVTAVHAPLGDDKLFVEVMCESYRLDEVKRHLTELLIMRQRWHVLERSTYLSTLATLRAVLHRAAAEEGLA